MRAEPKPLILVVEDEEELAKLICLHLEEAGMQTQVYNRCALALRFLGWAIYVTLIGFMSGVIIASL